MGTDRNGRGAANGRDEELDRFWDIDALLPARRPSPGGRNTDAVELELDPVLPKQSGTVVVPPAGDTGSRGGDFAIPSAPPKKAIPRQPESEYDVRSRVIRHVRIFPWRSVYSYYEEFARTAGHLYEMPGREAPEVSYFSFVPQYSQMNRDQLAFYLWWRHCLRHGNPIHAEYSYILLYLYELINLSDRLPPEEVQAGMMSVFRAYREEHSQLCQILPDWICDHALIHRIAPPVCDPQTHTALFRHCRLREFYLLGDGGEDDIPCLLASDLPYDYRRSKFYTEENRALYDETIAEVLRQVLEDLEAFDRETLEKEALQTLIRDAYTGALCSYRVKRRMEVTCFPLYRMPTFRTLVGEAVKCAENGLRAHLGIRSRLTLRLLPKPIRERIDAYFAKRLPPRKRETAEEAERREYEKLYDLPSKPFSARDAERIERESWNTTDRLLEVFADSPDEDVPPVPAEPIREEKQEPIPEPAEASAGDDRPFGKYRAFLCAALEADFAGEKRAASALGKLTDAVAGEINELASDLLGDVLLDEVPGGYEVIAEYREDVRELIADA